MGRQPDFLSNDVTSAIPVGRQDSARREALGWRTIHLARMKRIEVRPTTIQRRIPCAGGRHPTWRSVVREIPLPIRRSVAIHPYDRGDICAGVTRAGNMSESQLVLVHCVRRREPSAIGPHEMVSDGRHSEKARCRNCNTPLIRRGRSSTAMLDFVTTIPRSGAEPAQEVAAGKLPDIVFGPIHLGLNSYPGG